MADNAFHRKRVRQSVATAADTMVAAPASTKKLTVRLDPDLHHQLKVAATEADIPMSQIISDLVADYLEKKR